MTLRCYVSSKARRAEIDMWKALRGAGLPIVADWLDSPINRDGAKPSADAWARHWQKCLDQSGQADITLFYAPEGATQCGSLVKIGSALQAGRMVWIVSDYEWSIAHHPCCRVFKSIEDAISSLVAL
jgi:hypothetical protein